MLIPEYAKPIIAARLSGKRPADMIIVSDGEHGLHRRLVNPVVRTDPAEDPAAYEWGWIPGLAVQVYTTMDRIDAFVRTLEQRRPAHLSVWRVEDGAVFEHLGIAGFRENTGLYEHPCT